MKLFLTKLTINNLEINIKMLLDNIDKHPINYPKRFPIANNIILENIVNNLKIFKNNAKNWIKI